ncbi:hypothetical protein DITRI_Ditri11bG0035900 [Diplodiscus trichospermus]
MKNTSVSLSGKGSNLTTGETLTILSMQLPFGFAAIAILIFMYSVMVIIERFLRPNSSLTGRNHGDLESQLGFNGKLSHPSPKVIHHYTYFYSLPFSSF